MRCIHVRVVDQFSHWIVHRQFRLDCSEFRYDGASDTTCVWRIVKWKPDFTGNRAAKLRKWVDESYFRDAPRGSETMGAAAASTLSWRPKSETIWVRLQRWSFDRSRIYVMILEVGPYKGFADQVLKVRVVYAPFGKRPFRGHVDPTQDGAEMVNMVSDCRCRGPLQEGKCR